MLLKHEHYPTQTITNFLGNDSEEKFKQNLKELPDTWKYSTETVTYKLNSHGYRTKQFDIIDWSNSVVILGCSCVFGTGINESDTISSILQKEINTPVINLGIGGTGADFQYNNLLRLKQNNIEPKKIIVLWPNPNRFMYYRSKDIVETCMISNMDFSNANLKSGKRDYVLDYFLNKKHWMYNFEQIVQSANKLYPQLVNFFFHGDLHGYDLNLLGDFEADDKIRATEHKLCKSRLNYNSRDLEHNGGAVHREVTVPYILSKLDK